MGTFRHEIRLAFRRLLRAPAFAAAAIATLGLAVGASTSMFAVVERVVLNPLPYPDSDRLVVVQFRPSTGSGRPFSALPAGLYYQLAARARTLASVAAYRINERTITGDGEPLRAAALLTTPSLSTVLGVAPLLGRWFTTDEGAPGAPATAVLSHGLWMRRYGGHPAIVGRSVTLDGVPTAVVGVMPPSFLFPTQGPATDLWVADQLSPASGLGLLTHASIARLRAGATMEEARAELSALLADLPRVYPGNDLANALANVVRMQGDPVPLKEWTVAGYERSLWLLLAAALLVLLVACANVANLFLVRFETRQREVALRAALGAGRLERLRAFLNEAAVVAVAGSLAGLAIALATVRLLVAYGPATLPRLTEVRLGGITLLVTVGLALVIAAIFGAIPALAAPPPATALQEGGRGASTPGRYRARQLMMGGQVALAMVVLVASALMVRSVQQLRRVDPGFDATSTFTFRIGLPEAEYATRASAVAAHRAILERLSGLPEVRLASAATRLPLGQGGYGNTLTVEGRAIPPGTLQPIANFTAVAGGYAEAMGMTIVRGDSISDGQVARGEEVAVIDQALADAYFPGENPIGRRIASSGPGRRWLTITGVVGNTATAALNEPSPAAKLYLPMSVTGGPDLPAALLLGPSPSNMTYVVRSNASTVALLPRVRAAIDAVDPKLAMSQVITLDAMVDRSVAQMAFTMLLLTVAAVVALVLGVVGVYGVMAYVVVQRTREIGVRLALGGAPHGVSALIARQGGIVALLGAATGLIAAIAGGRFLESQLFGISARDPGVLVGATAVVVAVAIAACWLPAHRASRMSPVQALRQE
jgi:predicted permease